MTEKGLAVGTIIAASALLAGCGAGDPAPPIEIGKAQGSGKPIDYPTTYDSSGYFMFDQWPPACSFLTDAELKSVLPQATNIAREPGDEKIVLYPSSREVTAKGADCTITFQLPGMGASVLVSEETAGRLVTTLPKAELPPDEGQDVGDGCRAGAISTEVHCAKGRVVFKLSTPFTYQERERSREKKIRYSVNGKVSTFDRESDGSRKIWAFERRHVGVPLAKIIVAKL